MKKNARSGRPRLAATIFAAATFAVLGAAACSDTAGEGARTTVTSTDGGTDALTSFSLGTEFRVNVPDDGRVYVKLSPLGMATVESAPETSSAWDLAFEGFDIATNGGVSGAGKGGSFGPVDLVAFVADTAPVIPFISADRAGGAFVDWYMYEGAPTHALWSRYHVFGVKDGERIFKVQVLTYYGQRDGATISGLYNIRYAEVLPDGSSGTTTELTNLDGTAGGAAAPPSSPSECLDLVTGARTMLTEIEARASSAWHLCFRRQSISVNGEKGGPRGITAVDLEEDKMTGENIDAVKALTAASQKSKFDSANYASFAGRTFRGDRVISGLDQWVDRTKTPFLPVDSAWVVVDQAGTQKYLLGFAPFENPTTRSPGTVVMYVKPVKG